MSDSAGQTLALLGDEAAALGALHAGISAAYGYPGTPSTEILEYLIAECEKETAARTPDASAPPAFTASWCSNEKTALEAGLGVSFAGRRSIITMKHVGLNVAADPFMNGSLLGINGGLVIAVADDPGMHSSQNEQDSRFYASFAMIPCLEPRNQQEAYDMTREAFDISERFQTPVMLRMVTRLSHARAGVVTAGSRGRNPLAKAEDKTRWMLLPVHARRNYLSLIEKQAAMSEWSASHPANKAEPAGRGADLVVITAGLGGNYYEENLEDFIKFRGEAPARLHIGAYPLPTELIRRVCAKAEKVLVIEEGQPFIEERLRGILPASLVIEGKLSAGTGPGKISRTGELDPDNVRLGLGLPPRPGVNAAGLGEAPAALDLSRLPQRPPQLCAGCPHGDSYETIRKAAGMLAEDAGPGAVAVTADIGCYALGAAPPYEVAETIVCMGASVGMARGAAEAGIKYALGVIGDSTFLHSGITGLIDAAAADIPMTVAILDNSTVAMTGCQETILPSARLRELILGTGVKPEHLLELEAKKQLIDENAAKLKEEMEHPGLSVVVFRRECLEAFRKRRKTVKAGE